VVIALTWLIVSILVAVWASRRGRSGLIAFIVSILLSPLIGIVFVLVNGTNERKIENRAVANGEMKKCPSCAELVRWEAAKCRYCGHEFVTKPQ
jgi:hypothetical protein